MWFVISVMVCVCYGVCVYGFSCLLGMYVMHVIYWVYTVCHGLLCLLCVMSVVAGMFMYVCYGSCLLCLSVMYVIMYKKIEHVFS